MKVRINLAIHKREKERAKAPVRHSDTDQVSLSNPVIQYKVSCQQQQLFVVLKL